MPAAGVSAKALPLKTTPRRMTRRTDEYGMFYSREAVGSYDDLVALGLRTRSKEPASNYRELDRAQTRDVQPTRELSANRAALGARAHRARRRDRGKSRATQSSVRDSQSARTFGAERARNRFAGLGGHRRQALPATVTRLLRQRRRYGRPQVTVTTSVRNDGSAADGDSRPFRSYSLLKISLPKPWSPCRPA